MQTFNQALASLYHSRQITLEAAMNRTSNPDELKELIERGSGLNQSYGGGGSGSKPATPGNGHASPYAKGRPVGSRPPVR
jgi:twitching motility protein PilT